jgi:drug/metabolite transporter (DMT)-like permease
VSIKVGSRRAEVKWQRRRGAGLDAGEHVGSIVTVIGIAVLWGLAGVALVALGRYDDMPYWFQLGSGGSLFLLFALWSWGRRESSR